MNQWYAIISVNQCYNFSQTDWLMKNKTKKAIKQRMSTVLIIRSHLPVLMSIKHWVHNVNHRWQIQCQGHSHRSSWLGSNRTTFRKINEIGATRCQSLSLKCTKFACLWGASVPDPDGGAYSAHPDTLAIFKGPTSKRRGGKGRGGGGMDLPAPKLNKSKLGGYAHECKNADR